jgi:acetylornithine/succinyldiaminopimelate/putrescine aminotransferase
MLTVGRLKKLLKRPGRYVTQTLFMGRNLTGIHFHEQHIADLIGADSKDIVFTSGATESNNMSIKGVARFHQEKKRHIITTQTVGLHAS